MVLSSWLLRPLQVQCLTGRIIRLGLPQQNYGFLVKDEHLQTGLSSILEAVRSQWQKIVVFGYTY